MKTSSKGLGFIAGFEGVVLHPYNDPAGYATIGVGHLLHRSNVTELDKKMWQTFTRADAMKLLQKDVRSAEAHVNDLVKVKLSQNQLDALVSFIFNVGGGAFAGSTLLIDLNRGRYAKAADDLLAWDMGGGKHLAGLKIRRMAERKLFLAPSRITPLKKVPLPQNWWKRYVYGDTDCRRSLLVKLAKLARARKTKIFVRSGKRTYAEQVVLYNHYLKYGHPLAAKPGTSNHEARPPDHQGHAADCGIGPDSRNIGDVVSLAELRKYGLHLPVHGESWHVEEL